MTSEDETCETHGKSRLKDDHLPQQPEDSQLLAGIPQLGSNEAGGGLGGVEEKAQGVTCCSRAHKKGSTGSPGVGLRGG